MCSEEGWVHYVSVFAFWSFPHVSGVFLPFKPGPFLPLSHTWDPAWVDTHAAAAAAAKLLQSCPNLCDPMDGSPPGSVIPGILQARTLERIASSFSSGLILIGNAKFI